jgi:hypothetical protein
MLNVEDDPTPSELSQEPKEGFNLGEILEDETDKANRIKENQKAVATKEMASYYLAQMNHGLTTDFIKKARAQSEGVSITDDTTTTTNDEIHLGSFSNPQPAKRGRGRPKKVNFDTNNNETIPVKGDEYSPLAHELANKRLDELNNRQSTPTTPIASRDSTPIKKRVDRGVSYNSVGSEDDPEVMEKLRILKRLDLTYKYHPHLLESCPRKKPWGIDASIKALQDEERRVQFEKNSDNALEVLKQLDVLVHFGIEQVCVQGFDYRAEGLAAKAKQSQADAMEIFQNLAIKYGDYFTMSPESQYFFRIVQNTAAVIQMNSMVAKQQERMRGVQSEAGKPGGGSPPLKPEQFRDMVNNKYKDL